MRSMAICLLVSISSKVFAQQQPVTELKPLILIDTLLTNNEAMIVHPSKFVSISTINSQQGILLYGTSGRFGVIKIRTLPNIEFIRLNALLDKFQIEEKYRNLKVCINQVPVEEPARILADLKEIRKVEVNFEKLENNTGNTGSGYINIITEPVL